jgi:ferredoxin-type protein NapF
MQMGEAAHNSNRRAFLMGRSARDTFEVRLPWLATDRFEDDCTRCGECLSACPEKIIVPSAGGFPSIDFSRGECTFCGACADSCRSNLFDRSRPQPWKFKALISDSCLAKRRVMCRSCDDACAHGAIAFAPVSGRPPSPEINPQRCTGCGACVSVCPENAIAIQ